MKPPFFSRILSIASYFVVGVLATIVEWAAFYFFGRIFSLHYLVATALAIVISTFSNWLFGRLLTFRAAQMKNIAKEIGKVYLASVAGLLFNMLIMWLLVEKFSLSKMPSKIIATTIVFFYNYFVRKLVIYRERGSG